MKRAIYEQIVETIKNEVWDFDQVLEILIENFPQEKPETLRSIVNLEYQKSVKKVAYSWNPEKSDKAQQKRSELFNKFKLALNSRDYQEGVIVEFAKESRFSPAQFAKIILEEYYKTCSGFDSEGYIFTPETEGVEETVSKELKVKISKLIKNSALIEDNQKLATEIWLATIKDNNYGPFTEQIKEAIGKTNF